MNRGKIIILAIVTVAVAVSIYGVWYRHRQMQRVLSALGSPVAQLVAFAPEVEIIELGSPAEGQTTELEKTVTVDGTIRPVIAKKSPGASKGFANLRSDLVRDSSYDWQQSDQSADTAAGHNWRYALIFRDGHDEAQLAIDADTNWIMLLDRGPQLSIEPISQAMASYFADQFPATAKPGRK
jgi:hypothetical protein